VFLQLLYFLLLCFIYWVSSHGDKVINFISTFSVCLCKRKRERERDKWVNERVCKYLLVDILVVFDGWAFGVVAGGGWSGGKTPEQTTGVLLLPINELLHKTLPRVQNKQHVHINVINFNAWLPTGEIHTLKDARITTVVQCIFKPSWCRFSCRICHWRYLLQQQHGRWAAEGHFCESKGPSCALISN